MSAQFTKIVSKEIQRIEIEMIKCQIDNREDLSEYIKNNGIDISYNRLNYLFNKEKMKGIKKEPTQKKIISQLNSINLCTQ